MGSYHMLPTIGNHIVLIVAQSKMLQQYAHAKFSIDLHSKQKTFPKHFCKLFSLQIYTLKTGCLFSKHSINIAETHFINAFMCLICK